MERISVFNSKGEFYKGNTHLHTTLSDGTLTPSESVNLYKNSGYDFVTITDHWVYGRHQELADTDFLIFTGAELDIPLPREKGITHHVTIMANPEESTIRQGDKLDKIHKLESINDMIKEAQNSGHICIYAHPAWSQVTHSEFGKIKGCFAVETYNNTCEIRFGSGGGQSYFDEKLWKGKRVFVIASDDAHSTSDTLGGFISVKAESFTHKAIIDALKKGSFYASTGPEISDFYIENGTAFVECSPCDKIFFYSDGSHGVVAANQPDSTSASWKLKSKSTYVYAICENSGKRAWSQPIWL